MSKKLTRTEYKEIIEKKREDVSKLRLFIDEIKNGEKPFIVLEACAKHLVSESKELLSLEYELEAICHTIRFQDKLSMLGKNNALQYKRIECNDGFSISIQASGFHYSNPREDLVDANQYSHFELGFPSEEEEMIAMFAEDKECLTDTVYPYVEASLIQDMLDKHGGVKG